LAESLPRILK